MKSSMGKTRITMFDCKGIYIILQELGQEQVCNGPVPVFLFIVPAPLTGSAPVYPHPVHRQSGICPSGPCSAEYSVPLSALSFQPVPLLWQREPPAPCGHFQAVPECRPVLHEPPPAYGLQRYSSFSDYHVKV